MAFDVNAARAQRLEAKGNSYEFTVDGEHFFVPFELDISRLEEMRNANGLVEVFDVLLGAEQATRLRKHKMSLQDLAAINEDFAMAAGISLGEGSSSST